MHPIQNSERVKTFEILALGEMLSQYDGIRIAHETMQRGGTVDTFMRRIADKVRNEPLSAAADRVLGFDPQKDAGGYSLSRAMKAAYERNWTDAGLERSISDLVSTRTGAVPNGFFVPLSMLTRSFNIGTTSEAGYLTSPVNAGNLAADPARKVSILPGLGATFLSGLSSTLEVPTFGYSNDAQFLTETGGGQELVESTTKAVLTPKRASAYMQPSRQAMLQVSHAIDATLGRHLLTAIMEQVEYGALNGDGIGNSPVGLRSTAGVGTVNGGTNGAQINYGHLADLENLPGLSNVSDGDFSGYTVNSQTRRWLRTTQRATGLPFIWEGGERPLLGHRSAISQLLPANLTKGTSSGVCSALTYSADWSYMLVGLYGGGVDIVVDRITLAGQGLVKVTANLLFGVGITRPAAFSMMNDGLTV